jgi:hypothetical protein
MACALSMKTVVGQRMLLVSSRWPDITMSLLLLLTVAGRLDGILKPGGRKLLRCAFDRPPNAKRFEPAEQPNPERPRRIDFWNPESRKGHRDGPQTPYAMF